MAIDSYYVEPLFIIYINSYLVLLSNNGAVSSEQLLDKSSTM